jgi:chemotaxis protein methyltransferase CheR
VKGLSPAVVPRRALERLILLIREETGNSIPVARHGFLEEITARRTRAHGYHDATEYVGALAVGRLEGEWEQLISLVTVKESYFFRAPQQFRAIERHVLPRLLAAKAQDQTLDIWSAASARGEEPATLAMILAEHEALTSWSWRIVATDVDRDALATAERGLYGERAVSQVPERLLDRWFTRRGGLYELSPAIRSRIEYRRFNLSQTPYRSLASRSFDLVLLRNVLIYFRRPLQRRVVSEAIRHLAPHGYLFLGASETLWQIFDRLTPVDLGQCFAYRHPDQVEPAERATRRPPPRPTPGSRPTPPKRPASAAPGKRPASAGRETPDDHRPRRRFHIPPRADQPLGGGESEPVPIHEEPPPPLDDTTVSDEVRGDDSDHPPLAAGGSAQDLLLEAAEALSGNRIDRAAHLTAEARDADPSEPAVYALEGFLHDLQGRAEEASGAYRAALYLDPGLYQARVLLADCMTRLGNRDRAESEYRQVLAVLDRGGARDLVLLEDLPFPNRRRAQRLCRQALGRR